MYKKFLSIVLSISTVLGNVAPTFADTIISNIPTDDAENSIEYVEYYDYDEESDYEATSVYAQVGSEYKVTIPKVIVLSGVQKQASYYVKVEGDIAGTEKIHVIPEEVVYLNSKNKDTEVGIITQDRTSWSYTTLGKQANGKVVADGLTAGKWDGIFYFNIEMEKLLGDIVIPEDKLVLDKSELLIGIGDQLEVNAFYNDENVTNDVFWSSNNENIAVNNGVITALDTAQVGDTAIITATRQENELVGLLDNIIINASAEEQNNVAQIKITVVDIEFTDENGETINSLTNYPGSSLIIFANQKPELNKKITFSSDTNDVTFKKQKNKATINISQNIEVGTTVKINATIDNFTKSIDLVIEPYHIPGEPVQENRVEPTCTQEGSYDEVIYCKRTGEELSRENKPIRPLGHDWDEGVVIDDSTCSTDGVKKFVCKRCNAEKTEAISAAGHIPCEAVTENNIEPTCEEDGSYDTVTYCTVCGAELSRETTIISKLNHTTNGPVKENSVEPTCIEEGGYDTVIKCLRCNKVLSNVHTTIPELGHDWELVESVSPTLLEDGHDDFECTRCDETKSETLNASGLLINYDANGGTGKMEASSFYPGSELLLQNCLFTKKGSHFVGWSEEKDNTAEWGDGNINNIYRNEDVDDEVANEDAVGAVLLSDNEDFEEPEFNTTLYAVWAKDAYTIDTDIENKVDEEDVDSKVKRSVIKNVTLSAASLENNRIDVDDEVTVTVDLQDDYTDDKWSYATDEESDPVEFSTQKLLDYDYRFKNEHTYEIEDILVNDEGIEDIDTDNNIGTFQMPSTRALVSVNANYDTNRVNEGKVIDVDIKEQSESNVGFLHNSILSAGTLSIVDDYATNQLLKTVYISANVANYTGYAGSLSLSPYVILEGGKQIALGTYTLYGPSEIDRLQTIDVSKYLKQEQNEKIIGVYCDYSHNPSSTATASSFQNGNVKLSVDYAEDSVAINRTTIISSEEKYLSNSLLNNNTLSIVDKVPKNVAPDSIIIETNVGNYAAYRGYISMTPYVILRSGKRINLTARSYYGSSIFTHKYEISPLQYMSPEEAQQIAGIYCDYSHSPISTANSYTTHGDGKIKLSVAYDSSDYERITYKKISAAPDVLSNIILYNGCVEWFNKCENKPIHYIDITTSIGNAQGYRGYISLDPYAILDDGTKIMLGSYGLYGPSSNVVSTKIILTQFMSLEQTQHVRGIYVDYSLSPWSTANSYAQYGSGEISLDVYYEATNFSEFDITKINSDEILLSNSIARSGTLSIVDKIPRGKQMEAVIINNTIGNYAAYRGYICLKPYAILDNGSKINMGTYELYGPSTNKQDVLIILTQFMSQEQAKHIAGVYVDYSHSPISTTNSYTGHGNGTLSLSLVYKTPNYEDVQVQEVCSSIKLFENTIPVTDTLSIVDDYITSTDIYSFNIIANVPNTKGYLGYISFEPYVLLKGGTKVALGTYGLYGPSTYKQYIRITPSQYLTNEQLSQVVGYYVYYATSPTSTANSYTGTGNGNVQISISYNKNTFNPLPSHKFVTSNNVLLPSSYFHSGTLSLADQLPNNTLMNTIKLNVQVGNTAGYRGYISFAPYAILDDGKKIGLGSYELYGPAVTIGNFVRCIEISPAAYMTAEQTKHIMAVYCDYSHSPASTTSSYTTHGNGYFNLSASYNESDYIEPEISKVYSDRVEFDDKTAYSGQISVENKSVLEAMPRSITIETQVGNTAAYRGYISLAPYAILKDGRKVGLGSYGLYGPSAVGVQYLRIKPLCFMSEEQASNIQAVYLDYSHSPSSTANGLAPNGSGFLQFCLDYNEEDFEFENRYTIDSDEIALNSTILQSGTISILDKFPQKIVPQSIKISTQIGNYKGCRGYLSLAPYAMLNDGTKVSMGTYGLYGPSTNIQYVKIMPNRFMTQAQLKNIAGIYVDYSHSPASTTSSHAARGNGFLKFSVEFTDNFIIPIYDERVLELRPLSNSHATSNTISTDGIALDKLENMIIETQVGNYASCRGYLSITPYAILNDDTKINLGTYGLYGPSAIGTQYIRIKPMCFMTKEQAKDIKAIYVDYSHSPASTSNSYTTNGSGYIKCIYNLAE